MNVELYGAFLIGLSGVSHCMGMCGGIATSMASLSEKKYGLIVYHLGRLSSYTIAGMLIAGAFSSLLTLSQAAPLLTGLRFFAGIMMIIVACYLLEWGTGLLWFEKGGRSLWRYLSQWNAPILRFSGYKKQFFLGMLWGWLPCGLVYSSLSWAAVSGNVWSGGGLMFAFGLGTLPALLAMGQLTKSIISLGRSLWFKRLNALLLFGYGFHTLYVAIKYTF